MRKRPSHLPRGSESGATGLSLAVAAIMLFSIAALAVDLGLAFVNKRNLQAVTDAAAIAAIYGIGGAKSPDALASASLTDANNTRFFGSATLTGVTLGNAKVPTGASAWVFTPGGAPTNAVQVQTTAPSPIYFARVFLPSSVGAMTLPASATAVRVNLFSFCAGTTAASLDSHDSAVLNSLLSSAGASVNLSLVSYKGLANTHISAFSFLSSLSTQLNLTAGTVDGILASNVTIGQVIQAAIDALNEPDNILAARAEALAKSDALAALLQLQASLTGAASITVRDLLGAGIWPTNQLSTVSDSAAAAAFLNLLDLIKASAQLANGSNLVSVPAGTLDIPGVASVEAKVSVIERPQCATNVSLDTGQISSVHTSQVRILLKITLLPLLGYVAQIPLYIEVADGTAALADVDHECGTGGNPQMALGVTTGLVSAWIGQIDENEMDNFDHQPFAGAAPPPVHLVNLLGLVTIDGQGTLTPVPNANAQASFTREEIQQGLQPPSYTLVHKTVGTPVTSLELSSLHLSTNGVVGILLKPVVDSLLPLLTSTITSVVNSTGLLTLVNSILRGLGIQVGQTTVWVTGAQCNVPSLVQ
jgi:uncharacterized membrane protein